MAEKEKAVKKKKKEPEVKEKELHYVVPLKGAAKAPKPKRAKRAINKIREFFKKHLRMEAEQVLISAKVNHEIWKKSGEKIPKKIALKVLATDKKARVFLESEKVKAEKKPDKKEEKKEEKKEDKKKTEEEDAEKEEKKQEKRQREKAAETAAIKRGRKVRRPANENRESKTA